jgi:hypothetical protein
MKKIYKKKKKLAFKNASSNDCKFNAKKNLNLNPRTDNKYDINKCNESKSESSSSSNVDEKEKMYDDGVESFLDFYEDVCFFNFLQDLEQMCINHYIFHHVCGDCTCLKDNNTNEDKEEDEEEDFDYAEVLRQIFNDTDLLNINDVDTNTK